MAAVTVTRKRGSLFAFRRFSEDVLWTREAALANLRGIRGYGSVCVATELGIALDELRSEISEDTKHVIGHEDLPIAGW